MGEETEKETWYPTSHSPGAHSLPIAMLHAYSSGLTRALLLPLNHHNAADGVTLIDDIPINTIPTPVYLQPFLGQDT